MRFTGLKDIIGKKPQTSKRLKKPKDKKNTNKKKKEKKKKNFQSDLSSGSESDSDEKSLQSPMEAAVVPLNVKNGALKKKFENHPDYIMNITQYEMPELFNNKKTVLDSQECNVLDIYIKKKNALEPGALVVMNSAFCEEGFITDRDVMKVHLKWDEGRLSTVYICQKEQQAKSDYDWTTKQGSIFMLKTSIRQGQVSCARMNREHSILAILNDPKLSPNRRIVNCVGRGHILHSPFILMEPMDWNVEKIREEHPVLSVPTKIWIGTETLAAIRDVHLCRIVHRDVKPTNFCRKLNNATVFVIIDFGDASPVQNAYMLPPPDGYTLRFLSVDGHAQLKNRMTPKYKQDVESWLYMFYDLFAPLPWDKLLQEEEILKKKEEFWADLKTNFDQNVPPFVLACAEIISKYDDGGSSLGKMSKILAEAFNSFCKDGVKPRLDWLAKNATMPGQAQVHLNYSNRAVGSGREKDKPSDRKKLEATPSGTQPVPETTSPATQTPVTTTPSATNNEAQPAAAQPGMFRKFMKGNFMNKKNEQSPATTTQVTTPPTETPVTTTTVVVDSTNNTTVTTTEAQPSGRKGRMEKMKYLAGLLKKKK